MPHAPYLDLWMTPNRPFERRHMIWVIGAVSAAMLLASLRFVAVGAWPVIPFLLLDLALLWWAFGAVRKSGDAFEAVLLDDEALVIRRGWRGTDERRIALEPHFARVELERTPGPDNRLWLAARGKRVPIGAFLSAKERVEIHAVIADGLTRYHHRRG